MARKHKLFYKTEEELFNPWTCEHKSGCYTSGALSKRDVIRQLEEGVKDGCFFVDNTRFDFKVEDFTVLNSIGKVVVVKTKFGKTMPERSKENIDDEINELNHREMAILSKNLREGWHFKPGNIRKDFYRKPGDSEPQIYANINIEKVANRNYSKFGFEVNISHILEDTGLPLAEKTYGRGKYRTVLQARRKIDKLMRKIDNSCKRLFYSTWDEESNKIKWFRGDKEISNSGQITFKKTARP